MCQLFEICLILFIKYISGSKYFFIIKKKLAVGMMKMIHYDNHYKNVIIKKHFKQGI